MLFKVFARIVIRVIIRRILSRMATRGLAGRLGGRTANQRSAMRSRARSALRSRTAGRYGEAEELAEELGELHEEAGETVEAAYYEAMDTMYNMCANEGQETVFFDQVIPAFAEEMANTQIDEQWNDVSIGQYMVFMGEIVEEGNAIMREAFGEANSLASEAEDLEAEIGRLEELAEEGIEEDEFF